MKRSLRAAVAAAAVLPALVLLAAVPASAAPSLVLKPGELERGPDSRLPHVERGAVVDGDTRIEVPGRKLTYVGRSDDGYVVGVRRDAGWRTLEVSTSERRVLVRGRAPYVMAVSEDGGLLTWFTNREVVAVDIASGERHDRSFGKYASVIGARGERVVVSRIRPRQRTVVWNVAADRSRALWDGYGVYRVDLGHDLMARFGKDPYNGGCTLLSRFSDPKDVIWRDCNERIETFGPDGTRFTTVYILSDGVGPYETTLRRLGGAKVASYAVHRGYLGSVEFEDPTTVVFEANWRKKAADVRCAGGSCERASRFREPFYG